MPLPASPNPVDLSRFISAQAPVYAAALSELKNGHKRTHWMWFIFPQLDGLGFSTTTKFFAIKSRAEARQYLDHPLLGARLHECCAAVLAVEGKTISAIFDYPDDLKLKSCLTLFAALAGPDSLFEQLLNKYFQGERDGRTLEILETMQNLAT